MALCFWRGFRWDWMMISGWWCPGEAPAGHQLCSVGQQRKLEVGNGSLRQRPVPFTIHHWLLLGHSSVGLHFGLICPSVSPGLSVYWTSSGPHHLPASPQSVLLKVPPWHLPPSVSPWIASLMIISWVTMGVVYVVVVFACLPWFGFTCGYY